MNEVHIVTHNYKENTNKSIHVTSEQIVTTLNECFEIISNEKPNDLYNGTLTDILRIICSLTVCDYGFIGEYNWEDNVVSQSHSFKIKTAYNIHLKMGNICCIYKFILNNSAYIDNDFLQVNHINSANDSHNKSHNCIHEDMATLFAMPLYDHKTKTVKGVLMLGRKMRTPFSKDDLPGLLPILKFLTNTLTQIHNTEDIENKKLNFIANMGHEVRTPLNAIISMIELLSGSELTEKQFLYINSLKTSSYQLMDILNDILDFSRIINNGIKLKFEPISFHKCIESVVSMLNTKVVEKELVLNYKLDNEIPDMIMGDSVRLKQIIMNIISNSIKFTKIGTINVDVRLAEKSNDMVVVLIKIKDTGIGIMKDKIPKIFDAFRQIENDYLNETCGVGLGLSITKHLVELFKGEIWVDSEIGVGTEISMKIPFHIYNETIDKQLLTDYFKNKNILIFDNDINEREWLLKLVMSYDIKPILTSRISEIAMYLASPTFSFEFLLLNGNELEQEDIIKIHRLKNSSIKVIIMDINIIKKNIVGYDYKIIRPITDNKILELLNLIYITNQYNTLRTHNEIIIDNNIFKISNLNLHNIHTTKLVKTEEDIKILMAEDNKQNQLVLLELLRSIGCKHIDIAEDGVDTLNKLISNTYDVAFVDLKMPLMSGIDAVNKYIETKPKHSPIIIAVTANMANEVKKRCLENHMNGFIVKPISKPDLENIMKLILHNINK